MEPLVTVEPDRARSAGPILLASCYTVFLQGLASFPNTTVSPSPQAAVNAIGSVLFSVPLGLHDLAHMPLYLGLGALWCYALSRAITRTRTAVWMAVALSACLGLLLEISQLSVPSRVCSAPDALVNIGSAIVGALTISRTFANRRRHDGSRLGIPGGKTRRPT